jgi:hypothetical protein
VVWKLHWLEAEGDLGPWRGRIASEVEETRRAVALVLPLPCLDIMVQRLSGAVIPEIGMVGHAYRKGLFGLTLDPDNPHFARSLEDGTLRRQVAHEVHHCLRMAAVGYGRTLGEALVCEGLAGRFASHLFGTPPELLEHAIDEVALRAHCPGAAALSAPGDDHAAWFFGASGQHPRWLGYTLGYQIAGDWLAAAPDVEGDTWVNVPADNVLQAARTGVLAVAP